VLRVILLLFLGIIRAGERLRETLGEDETLVYVKVVLTLSFLLAYTIKNKMKSKKDLIISVTAGTFFVGAILLLPWLRGRKRVAKNEGQETKVGIGEPNSDDVHGTEIGDRD
jgi:hypothetical protein